MATRQGILFIYNCKWVNDQASRIKIVNKIKLKEPISSIVADLLEQSQKRVF